MPLSPLKTLLKNHTQFKISCLSEASLDRRLAWLLFLAPFLEVPVCSIALVHLQRMMDLLQCVTAIILQL